MKAGPIFSQEYRNKSSHSGNLYKKIILYVNDGFQAQLLAKLRYDNLKQKTFLKKVILAYLNDDPIMREFVYSACKDRIKKTARKKMQRDKQEKVNIINDFALDENDIQSIFDEIEKENPDL